MMTCKRCRERGKTWEGSDPQCAFEYNGRFNTANWMCATMSALRRIAEDHNGDGMTFYNRDDMSAASVGVIWIPEAAEDHGHGYIVMTWYKSRGRTGNAYRMNDDDYPEPLTIQCAEAVIEAYAAMAMEVTQ